MFRENRAKNRIATMVLKPAAESSRHYARMTWVAQSKRPLSLKANNSTLFVVEMTISGGQTAVQML
jgi:hypothetical protein